MGSALSLRSDFDGGARLRRLARQTRDADQARRLVSPASIYDGGSRSDAVRLGRVTVQLVRDWVAEGDLVHARNSVNASLICLVTAVDNDFIHCRRITTQQTYLFNRTAGFSIVPKTLSKTGGRLGLRSQVT